MTESFADEVLGLPLEDFVKVAKLSLVELLGESAASAVIYHLEDAKAFENPRVFEGRLRAVLGAGAEIVMGHILKRLRAR